MTTKEERTRVVIVGGGFGGINAAKRLMRRGKGKLEITVVDRRNHHLFQPLLYQVATAGLSPADIATPIRRVVRGGKDVHVHMAEVTSVDRDNRTIETSAGPLPYDYLLLSCGTTHSYFGHDEWEPFAPGLKTLEEAIEIRRRVFSAFEKAEIETDPARVKALLTFVVVGGGPTGVELAGALGEISRFTLSRDFKRIDPGRTRVLLIEGGPRILAGFDEDLATHAERVLEGLGVTVWTATRVTKIDAEGVMMDKEHLEAATVLWAAGVRASPLNKSLGVKLDRMGRAEISKALHLADDPHVYVVGDQACFEGADGKALPPLAPVAIQQGRAAADNILLHISGKPTKPFDYLDKGIMATIGRAAAIVQVGKLKFGGFFAWLTWCFIHILYLIGFRNRLLVLMQWIWSYLRFGKGARLITRRGWQQFKPPNSKDAPASAKSF